MHYYRGEFNSDTVSETSDASDSDAEEEADRKAFAPGPGTGEDEDVFDPQDYVTDATEWLEDYIDGKASQDDFRYWIMSTYELNWDQAYAVEDLLVRKSVAWMWTDRRGCRWISPTAPPDFDPKEFAPDAEFWTVDSPGRKATQDDFHYWLSRTFDLDSDQIDQLEEYLVDNHPIWTYVDRNGAGWFTSIEPDSDEEEGDDDD